MITTELEPRTIEGEEVLVDPFQTDIFPREPEFDIRGEMHAYVENKMSDEAKQGALKMYEFDPKRYSDYIVKNPTDMDKIIAVIEKETDEIEE